MRTATLAIVALLVGCGPKDTYTAEEYKECATTVYLAAPRYGVCQLWWLDQLEKRVEALESAEPHP
jgi:hypothetical protein